MKTNKKLKNFRFAEIDIHRIELYSTEIGISQTDLVERLLQRFFWEYENDDSFLKPRTAVKRC